MLTNDIKNNYNLYDISKNNKEAEIVDEIDPFWHGKQPFPSPGQYHPALHNEHPIQGNGPLSSK